MASQHLDRRRFLTTAASLTGAAVWDSTLRPNTVQAATGSPKNVAAIVTIYRTNSHADVIVGKILEGWKHDGQQGPQLRLASLYVDQFPEEDLSRSLADRFGFSLCDSIADAITLGQSRVAVDGVLCIGEHGDYPTNPLGQHLYPRRRFFEEVADTFERHGQVVPVFNDKHLGPRWDDARWMYDRARQLRIPFMAGSSLPVGYRDPDNTLAWGGRVESCLAVGYSGLDIYGFHTLEFLQSILERRAGAEGGVRSVQCLGVEAVPGLIADGTIQGPLLDAALASSKADRRGLDAAVQDASRAVFVIEYADGLRAPVLMLGSQAGAISAAWKQPGGQVVVTRSDERSEPRYPHFAYLLKGIEQMILTGQPAYPVERTLLTAGILDRALTSRHTGGQRLMTPELTIRYQPVDYSFAPHLSLGG